MDCLKPNLRLATAADCYIMHYWFYEKKSRIFPLVN